MIRCSLLLFPLGLALLAGCTTTQPAYFEAERAELDSLRLVAHQLNAQVVALRDSIQFYDDIDSGYYYREKNALLNQIEKLDYLLTVSNEGGLTVATLLADELFEPASATLTARGAERLAGVAAQLKEDYNEHRIRIEGHTDSVPPGGKLKERFPTNWELSAARALTVVRHLVEVEQLPADRVEAVAFGDTRPAARNDTAEGRRLNRRVRIAVAELPNPQ